MEGSVVGIHSAGAPVSAGILDDDDDGAFMSLRFGAEHGVLPMAVELRGALASRGGRSKIVDMKAGGDIDTEVFRGIERCSTFVVFGSAYCESCKRNL
eukprot:COSAG02_NODE_25925_length_645_cov_1.133700_1_plen_98_part_00